MTSVAMLLGGWDPASAAHEVAAGRRPSNDVRVLSDRFGADVYDFSWMQEDERPIRRLLLRLGERSGQWSTALALATAVRLRRYDAVYLSGEDVGVAACVISRLLPGRSPRFVLRVESGVYGRTARRRAVHGRLMAFASPRLTCSICRTSAVAAYLREELGFPEDRVVALGQEIDTDFFDPAQPAGEPVGPDDPYLLSAGLERRDYATLLDAVDGLSATLVIAAGSPWSKDIFAVDRGLPDNVVVGSYDAGEMRELYRRARVVVLSVHPSRRACGMNVVGEAWSMGRPVVATDTEGLRDFLIDGQNGLLVPPADAAALRAAIDQVLGSASVAARLGAAGQAHVRAELSLERFGDAAARALAVAAAEEVTSRP